MLSIEPVGAPPEGGMGLAGLGAGQCEPLWWFGGGGVFRAMAVGRNTGTLLPP